MAGPLSRFTGKPSNRRMPVSGRRRQRRVTFRPSVRLNMSMVRRSITLRSGRRRGRAAFVGQRRG